MAEKLERLQRNILKVIYGFKMSYREALEVSSLERLSARRQRFFDKFMKKAAENPRIRDRWFPLRTFIHPNLRRELIYEEKFAKTERLYKSPLYAGRRRLNEFHNPTA